MTKAALRKIYLKKRMDLSPEEYDRRNRALAGHFFEMQELKRIGVLHTFLPIVKNREVDTWLIVDRLRAERPGVKIAVPRVNRYATALEHYFLESRQELQLSAWGIPEPVRGVPLDAGEVDAVLVPLLAFDSRGHRVGYGKGFYDRFLADCRPECLKIGLSLFENPDSIDDTDEKDITLNLIITPEMRILFN